MNFTIWRTESGIQVDSFYDDLGYRPLTVKTSTDAFNQQQQQQQQQQQHSLSSDTSINNNNANNKDDNSFNSTSTTLTEQWDSSSCTLLFQGTIQGNSLVTIRLGENS